MIPSNTAPSSQQELGHINESEPPVCAFLPGSRSGSVLKKTFDLPQIPKNDPDPILRNMNLRASLMEIKPSNLQQHALLNSPP
jgi:hypothetical protein